MDELQKLLENAGFPVNEANPDGTISDEEEELRMDLLADFEAELDELLSKAASVAEEIGGEFRAPGIKYEIQKLVNAKMHEFTRRPVEWMQRLPVSQGGDMPDDEWQAAQDRK
jgi:hypothetical protein